MPLTAGSVSEVNVTSVSAELLAVAPTDGTTPYSYQWYRSTTTAFVPGGGNILAGDTALALEDDGLTPGTIYYYKQIQIDSAATPASVTTAQVTVTTLAPSMSPNQFSQAPFLGMSDLRYNPNTVSVVFDPDAVDTLVAGKAVKWSTDASGAPMVVSSTAQADQVAGFVNYNIKNQEFEPGDALEIAMGPNVSYLYATAAINRGQKVVSKPAAVAGGCNGGVAPVTGSSGFPIVGMSLDTVVSGSLVRIMLNLPSYEVDA